LPTQPINIEANTEQGYLTRMIVKENCNDFDPSNWLPKIKKRLKSTSEARNQLDITVPKNNKELKSDPNLRIQL